MKPKDIHIGISENMSKILYGTNEETGDEAKTQFITGYKAAFTAGIDKLAVFVIEQGRSLIKSDPNNYFLYLQSLGIYLLQAKEDQKDPLIISVLDLLKQDLAHNPVIYIKILSFLFSCLDQRSVVRVTIFQELVSICKANHKEYLFIPYLDNLSKIMPVETLSEDKLCELYVTLVAVLREKEKYKLLGQLITSFFTILSTRNPSAVLPHRETIHRCLTYLITDEEEIFAVEDFLANPLLQEVLQADQKLMESWSKFTSGHLPAAEEFYTFNEKYLKESGLSVDDIKDKMRYYRLSQIADSTKEMKLEELARQLEWSPEDVELFLIKVIEYGFVEALIDQMTSTVYFRAVHKRNLKLSSKKEISQSFDRILGSLKAFRDKEVDTN
jgi:hypothetical protein